MALEDVTKEYVDLISNNKYATRTSDTAEFEAVHGVNILEDFDPVGIL